MEKAFIKLVIAFIRWQLCIGMEHEDRLRNNVVQQLLYVEKVVLKESEDR